MLCTQVKNIWKDAEDRTPASVAVVTTNTETDQTTTKTFKTLKAAAAHARKAPAGTWIQWPNGNTETIKTPLFIGTTPICKTNYSKEIEMNYQQVTAARQKEVNEFPMRFAFNQKQFNEILEEWEIEREEIKARLVSIPGGGFIRKEDSDALSEMFKRHTAELESAMKDDDFLTNAIEYELGNHEFIITYDPDPALSPLGLEYKSLTERELKCYKAAKKKYLDWQCENG
jgi:hypothetical protein